MANNKDRQNSSFTISQTDLKDPTVSRLNQTISFILAQLGDAQTQLSNLAASTAAAKTPAPSTSFAGTHANRLSGFTPNSLDVGTTFWEPDRRSQYIIQQVTPTTRAWFYQDGLMVGTISPNQKPSDLGVHDANFRFYSTDFDHIFRWTGSAWTYGPGERSGYVKAFQVDPSPILGWHVLDGSTVTMSTASGGTTTAVLDDATANPFYLKAGAAYAANAAPVVAVIGSSTTGLTVGATGAPLGAATVVQSGTGVSVASTSHTHANPAPSDPGHTHTPSTAGEPQHVTYKFWFRL